MAKFIHSVNNCFCADIWRFPGVGNAPREHSGPQRQQVRGNVGVQRGDHVRDGGGHLFCAQRPAGRLLPHHLDLHPLLHHRHIVPCVRAKGQFSQEDLCNAPSKQT